MEMLEETDVDDLGIKILPRKNSMTNRNLLIAAWEGDKDLIDSCIIQGANINFVDRDGNTPLHYAIKSKIVEIVKFFVNNVENVNAENNECKTPLDIAVALKQNDIIKVLSEKNIEKSFEILGNQEDQKSDETMNKLTFMEATFHNDYKIPLSKDDIQNILDFTYFRGKGGNLFKAIDTIEDMENAIQVFSQDKKTTTLIFNRYEIHWITIVLYYTGEDKFTGYYIDSLGSTIKDLPTNITELFHKKGIEICDFQLKQQDNVYNSGIFSLKNADVFNSSNENEVKEKLQNINLNAAKERELYANVLMEKKRVEDKIVVCLETIQNLNKNKSNIEKLNHKNANVFINFLETFALQDTFPKLSKIWTPEELDQNKKKLTDLKKGYFSTYYFETKKNLDQKSDINLIRSARSTILHASKIIEPEDFKCFMKDKNSSVSEFFKKIELYTENIKNKINKNFEDYHDEIYCHSFLTFEKNIGNRNCEFLKILREFLLEIYKPEDKIDQEKIIFDVTVNIIPVMDKNKEKVIPLSVLRNNLVHNYQEKSISNKEKKTKEIKQLLHSLRSEIFKNYYSKEVHGSLSKMLLGNNTKVLQNEFQKILEEFQKGIVKEENITLISGEHSKSFEYIFQESLFPESDENINNLVDKYLKYAFIVEKKAGTEEVQIDDDYNEEEIEFRKLTDDKKREIFEDFMKLKKSEELTPAHCQYERNTLKEKLKMYGLEVSYFDRVVGYYLDDSNELPEESIEKRDKIISILSILKKIKKDCSLSNNTIINLYENFLKLKQKGITNLEKYGSSLNEILNKLNESQKSSILEKLCNFPGMETVDIMIGEVKFAELNTFDIIRNMLLVFCSSYDNYKIKFNNVEEAFNDDTFLHYLVNLNIEQNNNGKNLKDPFFVFTMIKKLITMEYACPYIAKLLIESNDITVIDKEDFIHLIGTLLKNNAYVKHLTKLLYVKSKDFNVYEEFCHQILDKSFKIENIHDILQEYNHVKAILNELDVMIQNVKSNNLMEDEASKVEEFCNKFLKEDFNIKNLHNLLQDYSEVKVILSKLSVRIENIKIEQLFENNLKEVIEFWEKNTVNAGFNDTNTPDELKKNSIKFVLYDLKSKVDCRDINYNKEKYVKTLEQITQQILKQLNIITYELHCDNCYHNVIKILEASIEASNKLKLNNELKNIILDAKFQMAKSIIQISRDKKRRIDEKKMNEALVILHQIENEQEKNPKFLLISAEIAYAQLLLKKYDESYKSYERLYTKIASNISNDFKRKNNEFSKLENSKEYQNMLTFSDDAKRYLSITNIQNSMALNKIFKGLKLEKDKLYHMYDQALHSYEEALKIMEELYSFSKKSLKNTLDTEKFVINTATKIARTKIRIAEFLNRENKYESALQCCQKALVKCIQYSSSLKKIYTDFHPIFKRSKSLMAKILSYIASTNEQSGDYIFRCEKFNQFKDIKKLEDIRLKFEETQKINKKLLSVTSYSESEKKRRASIIQRLERKIGEIKKEKLNIRKRGQKKKI